MEGWRNRPQTPVRPPLFFFYSLDKGTDPHLPTRCIRLPCRATMRLAMQSGTLVPAARKVMPMMTSGIPSVKPMTVT